MPQWRNWIARRTSNPEVVGSSPTWGIAGCKIPSHFHWSYSVVVITLGFDSSDMGSNPIGTSHAFVAQSVERRTFNPVVAGSSPAESIFFITHFSLYHRFPVSPFIRL